MNSTAICRWILFATVALVIFLLTSCLPDYFPRRDVRDKISEGQVVGRWHLSAESAEMLAGNNIPVDHDSAVEFFPDGACLLRNFVIGEESFSERGTWKIDHDVMADRTKPRKNVLRIFTTLPSGEQAVDSFFFWRHHRKLILYQYHGDPDGREHVDYERSM